LLIPFDLFSRCFMRNHGHQSIIAESSADHKRHYHALTLVTCHSLSCPWTNRHKYHSSRRRLTLFVSLMDFADVLNCTATPGGTEAVEKKSTGRVLLCRISGLEGLTLPILAPGSLQVGR